MPPKFRRAMADQERLKTLAFREDIARRRRIRRLDRIYYFVAILWAILAAFPSIQIGRPIPYMVGSTAPHDIHSRVEFTWRDPLAEDHALRNHESNFSRRYRMDPPLALWAAETYGPIASFLTRIASADDILEVEQAAKDYNIPATAEQLNAFWRGVGIAKDDPGYYFVTPLKEILDTEVYPQGILSPDRYEVEHGRTIRIIQGDSVHRVMVGDKDGPTTQEQLGPFLETRLRFKLSVWIHDSFKEALKDVVIKRMRPNLRYDEAGSKAEFEEKKKQLIRLKSIQENDILISRGSTITMDKRALLREEERVFRESQGWRLPATRFTGNFFLFLAISFSMVVYFKAAEGRRMGVVRRFFATAALCLLPILIGYMIIYFGLPGTTLPIGLAVGIAAFGMTTWTSIFLASMTSLCGLILFEGRSDLMIAHLAAGLFFISTANRVRYRIALIGVSFLAGLIGAIAFIAWNFARGDLQSLFVITSWSQAIADSRDSLLAAAGLILNWVVCGFVVLLCLPLIERYFRITTRIHLQDLASQEHPLLRRLIIEAPGTYHHSSIVSTLAEAAANAIGADGLKARIGALFHDIGKILKPEYFTENEFGISRHENMNPNMSALLIINHVRDGAEMARTFGLPNIVIDMILQHHGDSLMKFFYNKAAQQAAPGAVVAREPFLYPGPKPQTPEAGILMIADSVEAAVRSLDRPSPQHLKNLVARLVRERLVDGQFEESGLSMRQLAQIEDVLFRMLVSMYHTRVKYPGQERTERRR